MTIRQDDKRIDEQAAEWLDGIASGTASVQEYFRWLTESPKHVEEGMLTAALMAAVRELPLGVRQELERLSSLERANRPHNVIPLEVGAPARQQTSVARRRVPKRWVSIAACSIAVSAAGVWVASSIGGPDVYVTRIGEQRTLELEDGSVVHLNTQSRIAVSISERRREIRLVQGEALFDVRSDPSRPFEVRAHGASVRALGTQFSVYLRQTGTRVAVIEGLVQVSGEADQLRGSPDAPMSSAKLSAGEEANVTPSGRIEQRKTLDIARAVAWRQHRLVFRGDTLADIAAEFNRYNQRLEVLVQGEAAARRISGTFDANAPDSFARAIELDPALDIEMNSHRIVIRSRPTAPARGVGDSDDKQTD